MCSGPAELLDSLHLNYYPIVVIAVIPCVQSTQHERPTELDIPGDTHCDLIGAADEETKASVNVSAASLEAAWTRINVNVRIKHIRTAILNIRHWFLNSCHYSDSE